MTKRFIITVLMLTAFAVTGCGSGKADRGKNGASLRDKQDEQAVTEDKPENKEAKEEILHGMTSIIRPKAYN